MCQTVVFDDGKNLPAWEAETCAELARRLGGDLIRASNFVCSVDVSGDDCLCPVDLEATAKKFGLQCVRDKVGFEVIFKHPS